MKSGHYYLQNIFQSEYFIYVYIVRGNGILK